MAETGGKPPPLLRRRRPRYFDHVKPSRVSVYGFAGWIASFVAFAVVLLWGFAPRDLLERRLVIGQYLPDRCVCMMRAMTTGESTDPASRAELAFDCTLAFVS